MFPGNRPASVTVDPEVDYTTKAQKAAFPGARAQTVTADPQRDGDTNTPKTTALPFGLPFGTAVTHLPENVSTTHTDDTTLGGEDGESGVTGTGSSQQGAVDLEHTGVREPSAPTAVSATAGATQATVTWTAPADNGGSAITGYTVVPLTATARLAGVAVAAGSTSKVVTGLTTGTAYHFEVIATNAAGDSAPSATTSAVTPT